MDDACPESADDRDDLGASGRNGHHMLCFTQDLLIDSNQLFVLVTVNEFAVYIKTAGADIAYGHLRI